MKHTSQVYKWGQPPLNIQDPQKRFRKSEWNYFLIDQNAGILAGYWFAEQGHEILGEDTFIEIMHVIEGCLYVLCEGRETTVEPGDTLVISNNVTTKLIVKEPIRAFFICYSVPDPEAYVKTVDQFSQQTNDIQEN
jgi:uncharacterized cupin superfamily protein